MGFLYFERAGHDLLAGACAALTLIKPHLLLLFWCALLIRTLHQRRLTTILGAATTIVALSMIALLFNPNVFQQYIDAILEHPPYHWASPTIGTLLRLMFGWQLTWLIFAAPFLGVLWAGYYARRHKHDWRWEEHLPLLLLVSVMTTPYGWDFDQIVLLLPIIHGLRWVLKHRGREASAIGLAYAVTCLFGFYVTAYRTTIVSDYVSGADTDAVRAAALSVPNTFWFVATTPALLLMYLWSRRTPRDGSDPR